VVKTTGELRLLLGQIFNVSSLHSYFYLYRISYMYAVILGFLVTLVIGYISSYFFYLLKLQDKEKIHVIGTNDINTDLFSPPIAKKLKSNYDKKQTS
jgi:hypothetical protein